MNKFFITALSFIIVLQAGCASPQKSGKPVVFVSILPQVYFVERIAGDKFNVVSLTAAGQDPHTFEPTPDQMMKLSDAVLYFSVGITFEQAWMDKIKSANPSMKVVGTSNGIELMRMPDMNEVFGLGADNGGNTEHEHGLYDPHIWLSPALVKTQASNIYAGLCEFDPADKGLFSTNLVRFISDLDALSLKIKKIIAASGVTRMLVFHPAWGYFAKEFGLTQIPVEFEGKEPSLKQLEVIIDFAKKEKIGVLFVQPQLSEISAKTISEETGCKIIVIDPLAVNYIENLENAAKALAENK